MKVNRLLFLTSEYKEFLLTRERESEREISRIS